MTSRYFEKSRVCLVYDVGVSKKDEMWNFHGLIVDLSSVLRVAIYQRNT